MLMAAYTADGCKCTESAGAWPKQVARYGPYGTGLQETICAKIMYDGSDRGCSQTTLKAYSNNRSG